MGWPGCALVALFALAAFATGILIGRRKNRGAVWVSLCAGLAFILARVLFNRFPDIEYDLFPQDAYVPWRIWWVLPFAFIVLGVGLPRMTSRGMKLLVAVFTGLLFGTAGRYLVMTAAFEPLDLAGKPGKNGVCLQTSGVSCGAAAASTLLAQLDVPSDEAEMARLCGTNALTGTDEFSACRGLRQKLAGRGFRVDLVRSDWETLRARRMPAMATMKFASFVDHWVVVFGADENSVRVGDPMFGLRTMSKARFLAEWRCVLVTVDPD